MSMFLVLCMWLACVVTQHGSAAWNRNVVALSWVMFTVLTIRFTVTTTVPRVLWRVLLTTLVVLPISHHMTRVDVPQTLSWQQMYVCNHCSLIRLLHITYYTYIDWDQSQQFENLEVVQCCWWHSHKTSLSVFDSVLCFHMAALRNFT